MDDSGSVHSPAASAQMTRRIGTAGLAIALGVIGVFTVEPTAHHDDAAQYWTMAGRLASTREPFYVAAVDHKGPLWVGTYRLASAISHEQALFWFLMAAQVVVFAAITGAAVWSLLGSMGAPRRIASIAASLLTLYLVFGPEGYSDLLYGRNITTALTAVGVALAWRALDPGSARAHGTAVVAGAACGLATQTVFTTAIPVALLTIAFAVIAWRQQRSVVIAWMGGVLVALASVIIWYAARGAGDELRTWLWDYNLVYGGSDVPLAGRLVRTAREIGTHLITRPFLLLAPIAVASVAKMAPKWRRPTIITSVWWIGELLAISAPDRWFGHYWILLAAPTACLGGLVASAALEAEWAGRRRAATLLAGIAALYALPGFALGTAAAAAFSGVDAHQAARVDRQPEPVGELRAAVEAQSTPGDPIFVWASAAGPYVALDRPAASRFDRRTWLTGEIYGSDSVAQVPGVWDLLMDDLADTEPVLIVEYREVPIPASSPLGRLVTADYDLVVTTSLANVFRRSEEARDRTP